jgi:coenzyme F420-reducing hydrogenase gamma subunit
MNKRSTAPTPRPEHETDEVSVDYTIEGCAPGRDDLGTTHILVVHFPEPCDELCGLLALKNFLKSRSQQIRNKEKGIEPQ